MNRPVIVATIAIAGSAWLVPAPGIAQDAKLTQPNSANSTSSLVPAPQRTPGTAAKLHSSADQGDAKLLAPGISQTLGQPAAGSDARLTDANAAKQTAGLMSAAAAPRGNPGSAVKMQSMTAADADVRLLAPGISTLSAATATASDAKLTDVNSAKQTSGAVPAPKKGTASGSAKLQSMTPSQGEVNMIAPGISSAPK